MKASDLFQALIAFIVITCMVIVGVHLYATSNRYMHRIADLEEKLSEKDASLKNMQQLNIKLWLRYIDETKEKP